MKGAVEHRAEEAVKVLVQMGAEGKPTSKPSERLCSMGVALASACVMRFPGMGVLLSLVSAWSIIPSLPISGSFSTPFSYLRAASHPL